jgi:hypothetical protein
MLEYARANSLQRPAPSPPTLNSAAKLGAKACGTLMKSEFRRKSRIGLNRR